MLLIIFLGLIASFTLVSGECKVGTQDVKNFDWSKVRISVFKLFLKQADFKTAACFMFLFWFHLEFLSRLYQNVLSNY
jgi:hypothetical protein